MAERNKTLMKKSWLAVIHVAAVQLGLTDEEYRAILKRRYGVRSARDLTSAQGKDLIDYFKSLGFLPVRRVRTCTRCLPRPKRDAIPMDVVYPASPGQLAKIKRLRDDIKWWTVDGFSGWLKRYFNIERIQTSIEASQVIYGLLRLWRSQNKCKCSLIKEG
ncbi:MAG: DUF1018 domain-containing protein [Syntrophorhabdus aromaticivorans]|uniref:DUF1018 domain-containing protein n=1 Tax=Syntrophorhabdus aromaticivorans TaxID=328301 RepID=A0A971M5N4_9BACT|nr:DUF1018 domain-containing protein [Syntrophorhabdus aromaticivorans]